MGPRATVHRVYFSPGLFGFGRLASYDYFAHLERALQARFRSQGLEVETYVLHVPPTASVSRRASRLAELVSRTCDQEHGDGGPIHLVGHSTGGLDVRLLASPGVRLPVEPSSLAWLPRLASVTTLSAPHWGTPLAGFFATVSGQRLLYALSALTFIALSLGAPPLAAASALVVAVGRLDRALGIELRLLDRVTDGFLRVLDDTRSREVRAYLDAIKGDQGGILQITPEAMDLFQASVHDRPGVRYQCTASMAPPLAASRMVRTLAGVWRPWSALSTTLFATLQGITSRFDERYPCAAPALPEADEGALTRAFGRAPGARANDGVVPLRSQVWGHVVWAGYGDHLDILGHFRDDEPVAAGEVPHVDWMASGAHFDRARFAALCDAVAAGMVEAP